ncbi:helix-turn-helix domain-containing protein [Streptomyces sp. NPDC101175]|uniref:helix-turn-helix domain-containing protein n=1 Tax=Streptomyces sp. NPDC101175 TaxID=3366123 RepID=UPI003839192F
MGAETVEEIVEAYREGATVKELARQYGVDPKTVCRVLDSVGARDAPDDLGVLLRAWSTNSPNPRCLSTSQAWSPSTC